MWRCQLHPATLPGHLLEEVVDFRINIIAEIREAYASVYAGHLEFPAAQAPRNGHGREPSGVSNTARRPFSSPGRNSRPTQGNEDGSMRSIQSPGSDQPLPTPGFDTQRNCDYRRWLSRILNWTSLRVQTPSRLSSKWHRQTSQSTVRTDDRARSVRSETSNKDRLQSGSSGPKNAGSGEY